ncbi:unnamed protein product [Arctia plantaginis]|uniref:Uncharacterized protein n=1 Tax=Arctia plantaginis TaxID=874455 RepID=A0A8S1BUA3_ARCPL|nr:unnamed protein product [Arctia plantaginis]CAB3260653.1 unnamed protein product [Arctia plantaginis]
MPLAASGAARAMALSGSQLRIRSMLSHPRTMDAIPLYRETRSYGKRPGQGRMSTACKRCRATSFAPTGDDLIERIELNDSVQRVPATDDR